MQLAGFYQEGKAACKGSGIKTKGPVEQKLSRLNLRHRKKFQLKLKRLQIKTLGPTLAKSIASGGFMKKHILAVLCFLSFSAHSAMATLSDIQFGQAKVYGAGCSNDKVTFSPSPEGTSFSVLFDGFTLESKKQVEAKYCTILVPVTVASGKRLKIQQIDLRGFMDLQKNTWGGAGALPGFMNIRGQTQYGSWAVDWIHGSYSENFIQSSTLQREAKSFCGSGTQWLVLHTFAGISSYRGPSQVANTVMLDTIDGAGQLQARLQTERCSMH